MYDSLQSYYNDSVIGDTAYSNLVLTDSSIVTKSISDSFLQIDSVEISPVLNLYSSNTDFIAYVLLILLGIISVLWYFLPDRFSTIFLLKSNSQLQRTGENIAKVPGTLVMGFLWLNFVISICIFIFLLLQMFFAKEISGTTDYKILGYIFLLLTGWLLYRFIIIFGAAVIFETQKLKRQQVIIGGNINIITGVLLVPTILFILYAGVNLLIYIGAALILCLQVYRLLQTVIIGKLSTIFSALHIILYLCTLEIVPVLVLIGLIGNAAVI